MKLLISSLITLAALTQLGAQEEITYTTENGYFGYNLDGSYIAANNTNTNNRSTVGGASFKLTETSINAGRPTGDNPESLTSYTGASSLEAAQQDFTLGSTVYLTSIVIHAGRENTFGSNYALRIVDSTGAAFTSDVVTVSSVLTYDAWETNTSPSNPNKYTVNRGTFTFSSDNVALLVGTEYDFFFVDATTGAQVSQSLQASQFADADGWSLLNANGTQNSVGFGPAGMTVITSNTAQIIPEPATATMGLAALLGLLVRRRRKS